MLNSRSRIATAVAAALAAASTGAQESDAQQPKVLDEVTVTGSFIRRSEGFTPASPVAEIGKVDFEANAPKTVADFLTTLPYSYNSSFTVGRALGTSNGSGSINLRNLGPDATLVLLNSRRVARDAVTVNNVDVNSLVPQIAIERLEILKDGASSIYGSDAVGGVANFFTRSKFEGLELGAQADMRTIGPSTDFRFSGIWGAQSEKTHVIVAAEFFNRTPYNWESFEVISSRAGTIDADFRLTGWPARYTVPNRGSTGALLPSAPAPAPPATTTLADPQCSEFTGANTVGGPPIIRQGITYPSTCVENVALGTSANADEKRFQVYAEMQHEFNSHVSLFTEVGFLRTRTALIDAPGAAVNPGPGQPAVVIPGYAPGNEFRAVTSTGALLYAQPSAVQLSYDKNGDGINEFVPARSAAGVVVLNLGVDGIAGTPDDAVGGVPFWEDVQIAAGSRIFGLNCNLPGDPATRYNCRTEINPTLYAVDSFRIVTGFEGEVAGDWRYETAYTFSTNSEDNTTLGAAFSMPALRSSLSGFGGAGCLTTSNDPLQSGSIRPGQGLCQFLNIFGNSVTTSPGTPLANTKEIVEYVTAQDWSHYLAETGVFDLVFSGSLFSLPAGPVGAAFGAQHREEKWVADYTSLQNQGQSDLQAPFYDKNVDQSFLAIFAEINVPIFAGGVGSLDFSGAVRYEESNDFDLETTDPKVGLLYSTPEGMLKARATWSTSFLAPSLYQRFRQNVVFTNGVDDGLTTAVENIGRVPTQITGNTNLDPQTSENYNLGVTVTPIESLTLDLDYWHFKFEDQIALENGLAIALDPTSTRDPTKVIRNPPGTGQIIGLNLTYVNNATVETAGFDFAATHDWDLGVGALRNTLQATYQTTYEVNGVDVKGSRNGRVTGASFAVPWRATLRTDWKMGGSSLQSLLRYTDGYHNDVPGNAGSTVKTHVEHFMAWDLSYTYSFQLQSMQLRNAGVSLGVNNVTDEIPPWVPDGNHTLFTMYDYSGRHAWLRLKAQF